MMETATWVSNGLGEHPSQTLESFQKGLTVSLIATRRHDFKTCSLNEKVGTVIERNREDEFDFLPVTEKREGLGRIIGLIEIAQFMNNPNPQGLVKEHMRPLTEENVVGADASILRFVRDADHHRCRLIISGLEISGLVSLSDLQQLPVRAALFAMVTHLEMVMADNIRSEFGGAEDWTDRLSPERQSRVRRKAADAKSQDAFIDTILYTEFCDKVTVIRKRPEFGWSKKAFESNLNRIQSLRNKLAHASDYATTRDDACRVCETVRFMDLWADRLAGRSA